ncbi:hypothetical protein [Shewanella algae]|uniref:hypothetical protein n=1 Tax=Shewanella algae TaxID=38313 RepID=UPI0031F543B2
MQNILKSHALILALCFGFVASVSAAISRTSMIEVTIDKNSFSEFSITSINFYPAVITLNFDSQNKKFFDASVAVEIETDIESSLNNPYTISYQSLITQCVNRETGLNMPVSNWVEIKLDNVDFNINEPMHFGGFAKIREGFRYSRHTLDLLFNSLPLSDSYAKCEGAMNLIVEFDI